MWSEIENKGKSIETRLKNFNLHARSVLTDEDKVTQNYLTAFEYLNYKRTQRNLIQIN